MTRLDLVLIGLPELRESIHMDRLIGEFQAPFVRLSDILRSEVAQDSESSEQLKTAMARGGRLPDDLVLDLVVRRLSENDVQEGFILAGFPRTVEQAEVLSRRLSGQGRGAPEAIVIDESEADVVRQTSSRRVCVNAGHVYDCFRLPSLPNRCDEDGSRLIHREQDQPDVVRERLAAHRAAAAPLLLYYEQKGLLRRIDGTH